MIYAGLFPDIGASYFLPRLQGKLGYYLGLTGLTLKGIYKIELNLIQISHKSCILIKLAQDVLHSGIATHYCDSSKIPDLEKKLLHMDDANKVEEVINDFCPKIQSEFSLVKNLDQINECFNASSVEEILEKLEKDGSEWASKIFKVVLKLI